jgi:flagellar hook assembly protein FlgD
VLLLFGFELFGHRLEYNSTAENVTIKLLDAITNKRQSQHWAGKENDGNKHENNSVKIDMSGLKKTYLYLKLDFFYR